MHFHSSIRFVMALCAGDGTVTERFSGVTLERLGDLARAHGVCRWKRAPASKGRNAHIVEFSLRANELALYSHQGNRAIDKNGSIMATGVLQNLSADDCVVLLDFRYEAARSLIDGTTVLTLADDSFAPLTYRGDAIRAANHNDVETVIRGIIQPTIREF